MNSLIDPEITQPLQEKLNSSDRMHRRSFIQLCAFSAAAIGLVELYGCGPDSQTRLLSKPEFLSLVAEKESIIQAGKEYIQSHPTEQSTETLIASLMEGVKEKTEIASALGKKIQADFDTGRTMMVDGWVLSITEARQCALFSTLHS